MPKFFTVHSPAPKPGIIFKKPSKTDASFLRESDINHLIARYNASGCYYDPLNPPRGEKRLPVFDDFENVPDFAESQAIIADASRRFEALPATVRKAFDNDPTLLLAFISDSKNREKAEELGLLTRKAAPVVPATVSAPVEPTNDNPTTGE